MVGKNNLKKRHELRGEKVETYSIKKFKVGAASVLIGVGIFFGAGTVEASDNGTQAREATNNPDEGVDNANIIPENSVKPAANKIVNTHEKVAEAVVGNLVAQSGESNKDKATTKEVDKVLLTKKIEELKSQLERIKNNTTQQSLIDEASKKLESAEALIKENSTQEEVDKKAKEISSFMTILKSIKAVETSKENKNQDSRNGKKIEEGTGFRTGVTDQALTGSIHFDTSKGPTEKRIPVANNGMGERVINMVITYSASSNDTVTDGKVRVTIPKAFLHSNKKPVFTNSSFVKSTDDRSTATDYVYDLNLNPMSGGSVAESLLKLYVGTSIKNAPSKDDSLPVKTEFISGENVLSTKTATATFDYLSEIIYRENDTREKLVKNYLPQEQREYKLGSVVDGKLTPVKTPFRIPLIMTNDRFFNNREADEFNQNGNGRLTSYDYTISGIPEFLELDPTSPKNSKWTLENGVATLHPDQTRGIDQMLYYAGPVLRLKEGALSTPEEIAKVIETNGTKGYSAKIVYNAVGHRPDGSSFMQSLENPDGFRIYAGDGAPAIGMMEDRINATTDQRLFSNASNVDTFGTTYRLPLNNLKTDGGTLPSQYLSYFIPKDQEGNYFTKFKLTQIFTNESENGSSWVRGYHSGYKDVRSQFKENFQLYGVNENNQAELIKDYTTIDELFNETIINSDKRYHHLILKTPGIVDEVQDKGQASKTILGLTSDLDVTVGTWKEKAKDPTIQRYENKISQVLSASNTIESAIATERPNTGSSTPAVHTKKPTTLSLGMQQIGDQELTKDNLTRGKNIPIAVQYTATDYFKLAESEKNGIKVYDLDKLDSNINKTSVMLLADPKLPLKDFRLTADNRLLSKNTLYFGGVNGSAAKDAYNQIKESYDTVNPTRIIENYKGTGKRAYIFESKDLGLSSYDLNRDGWIKGGTYNPVALTFEVENNGQIESGTYNIESYLVWNSDSETLFGNDRSLNANYVEGHEPGSTIAKSNINVTMNNVIEYSTSLTISKPGTTGTRGIIDVKNGQEVILTPQVENLTDAPQKIKEAVVLIPKSEAVTYLEGPIVENSDEYDVEYTTSTATDKTTGTYVTADKITNWKDVTAVKYVFKKDYTVTKEHAFTHNFNLRVDADNPNFVESTSQIFLKNNQNVWLESNTVGLRTEDTRGKLEVRYINNRKDDILPKITEKEFAGQPYTTTKEDIIPRGTWSGLPYLFKEIQADSVSETGTYERQVTKKVTYVYEEATFKEESKTITRTINYLEKNNESNVVANPVVQNITVKRKIYTGKETGRVIKGPWEYRTDAYQPNWPTTNSPRVANFEAPDREVIDRVLVSQDLINNGNVVENVYYERIMPIGGDVVAKYVIEGTTTELKAATDVAKGLKVGKNYTSTAPVTGEELTANDGKVYVYKGHKGTSAAETGTVTADKQEVVYEYAPKVGGNVIAKYVIKGTTTELKASTNVSTGAQVGSDYTATAPQAGEVLKQGELEYVLEGRKSDSAAETGKVTADTQEIIYEYVPKQGGNVIAKYVIKGTTTELKASTNVSTGAQVGSDYTATAPQAGEVLKQGELEYVLEGRKADSAAETGKVTADTQEIIYEYVPKQGGNVEVKYVILGTETNLKDPVTLVINGQVGSSYTATKDLTITKDGKLYKLVEKNGGLKEGSSKENGKVSDTPTVVTYVYSEVKGEIIQKFVDESGKEIKDPTNTGKKSLNEKVNLEHPNRITDKDGKVYEFVKVDKIPTNFTEQPQTATYTYRAVKGQGVTVSYETTTGVTLKETQTVQPKDTVVGTDYDTSTETLKPERIEKDGKVYLLKEQTKAGSAEEKGKVSEQSQNVTYVYEEVKEPETKRTYGSVVVLYTDQSGRPISGITNEGKEVGSTVIDTPNAPLNTKYDTTDNRPQTITTKDGKVYKLKKVTKNSDAEQSGVKGRTSVVTYVYEMLSPTQELPEAKIGVVLVNYQDEDGNPISGKTPEGKEVSNVVVDTDAALVDTEYDTTDNKPSVIIVENGDVYEFVKVSETSVEKGKVVEGTTIVDYIYRKVVTTFIDENGKEIKSSEKGTKSKVDISGYEFKETKKDEKGNTIHVYTKKSSSTPDSPKPSTKEDAKTTVWKDKDGNVIKTKENGKKEHSAINGYVYDHSEEDKDGNTTHIYRKVNSTTSEVKEKETSYVDENGKTVQTTKQGQHPQDKISGYEFVRTETDANGNVRHVYRQVAQSPATVEQRKNELPNTGTGDEFTIFGAAAASILAGLGIAIPGKKKEEEK